MGIEVVILDVMGGDVFGIRGVLAMRWSGDKGSWLSRVFVEQQGKYCKAIVLRGG